jgi:hypothetical protein
MLKTKTRYILVSILFISHLIFQAFTGLGCIPQSKDDPIVLTVAQDEVGVYASVNKTFTTDNFIIKCYILFCDKNVGLPQEIHPYDLTNDTRGLCNRTNLGAKIVRNANEKIYFNKRYSLPATVYTFFACYNQFGENGSSSSAISYRNMENISEVYTPTFPTDTPPSAPSGLSSADDGSNIELTWTDNSDNESGFIVERSDDAGATFTVLATTTASATSYSDNTALVDTSYDYRIKATNTGGDSAYTNTATHFNPTPSVPTALSAFALPSQINLTWTLGFFEGTSIVIERSTVGGGVGFTQIGTEGPAMTTHSDTTVAPSTTYYYRVRVLKGSFSSAYSSETSITSNP